MEEEVALDTAKALCLGFLSYCRSSFLHSLFQFGMICDGAGSAESARKDSMRQAPSAVRATPDWTKFRRRDVMDDIPPVNEEKMTQSSR